SPARGHPDSSPVSGLEGRAGVSSSWRPCSRSSAHDASIALGSVLSGRLLHRSSRNRLADAAERLSELRRDDEYLVGVPFGQLGQHLQIFVAEQLTRGFAVVDRFEDRVDRLRFALRPQHSCLAVTLGAQHHCLLLAFGREHLSLLLAFCCEDRRTTVALSAHLLLHRRSDVLGRVDRLDLHAVDAYPPL